MPELPEITILAQQMGQQLAGRRLEGADVVQEKCLNLPKDAFCRAISARVVVRSYPKGKWVFTELDGGYHLLLNLGMGAEVRYHAPGSAWQPDYQVGLRFDDGAGLSCRFWWLGYVHLMPSDRLSEHKLTAGLAVSPLDPAFTLEYLAGVLSKSRTAVKTVLLDQRKVAGIGNVYVQDILFRAGLHPLRPGNGLRLREVERLYDSIHAQLEMAISKHGLLYERDLYGQEGGFGMEEYLVAYKEGKPCPVCGTTIAKIKTGSTASYICPNCQVL